MTTIVGQYILDACFNNLSRKMSVMSEIHLEIQNRLDNKEDPCYIAKVLNIPKTWVYGMCELMDLQISECENIEEFVSL